MSPPRRLLMWLLVLGFALFLASSGSTRVAGPGPLHIHQLDGSVVALGTWGTGADRYRLYGVRLRATLCLRSPTEATEAFPSEIRITHFAVSRSRSRWWPARTSIDRAPWLVPFGEGWNGESCGRVVLEDSIPPTHYGVESLGNPNLCYGVGLTIKSRGRSASKRAVLTCGRRFG